LGEGGAQQRVEAQHRGRFALPDHAEVAVEVVDELGCDLGERLRLEALRELLDEAAAVVERRRRTAEVLDVSEPLVEQHRRRLRRRSDSPPPTSVVRTASGFCATRLPPGTYLARYRFLPVSGSTPSNTRSCQ